MRIKVPKPLASGAPSLLLLPDVCIKLRFAADSRENECSEGTLHWKLFALHGPAVALEGALPGKQGQEGCIFPESSFTRDAVFYETLQTNNQRWLHKWWGWERLLKEVLDRFSARRFSYHFHCCGPAPGAGRRSQVPQTDGSTISHSLTDGPVCSGRKRREKINIW